jgi:hypothetical protein
MPRTRKGYTKQPQQRISKPGRRQPSRPSIAEMPAPSEIDPYSSCPPPPPGYDGDWYSNCLEILGIR